MTGNSLGPFGNANLVNLATPGSFLGNIQTTFTTRPTTAREAPSLHQKRAIPLFPPPYTIHSTAQSPISGTSLPPPPLAPASPLSRPPLFLFRLPHPLPSSLPSISSSPTPTPSLTSATNSSLVLPAPRILLVSVSPPPPSQYLVSSSIPHHTFSYHYTYREHESCPTSPRQVQYPGLGLRRCVRTHAEVDGTTGAGDVRGDEKTAE